jgi:hypothetical protein
MSQFYDSTPDTQAHIALVRKFMQRPIVKLMHRAATHDASKLESPEKAAFDKLTPRLKGLKYGSEEYRASLREMKPAIDHHYQVNSHHPEHYPNGINGMSLLDLMEMLCDWGAAQQRHDPPGNFEASFKVNVERFKIGPQLESILRATVKEMGWE